jgi:outer membrane protein OmpA-like peptidoglycan-associated protein
VETQERKMGYTGRSRSPSKDNKPATAISSTSERSRRTAANIGGQPTPGKTGEIPTLQTPSTTGDIVKGGLIRFEWGNDQLSAQAKKDLEALSPLLFTSPLKIMVKGYVAPTEEGEIYRRDIYLAHARAVNVMDYLISLGLKREFFQMSAADSTASPNRDILPAELRADPKLAGASAAVFLINRTRRQQDDSEKSETPVPPE